MEEVYHPLKKGPFGPDNLARKIEKVNEGFQLLAETYLFISPLPQEAMVSITMPRTDREVEGPSRLWAAIGMLKVSQTLSNNMASDSAHC